MVKVNRRSPRGQHESNPFKEKAPGWLHYALLFVLALFVFVAFLVSTEQGKEDARQFHRQHIAKHLHHKKKRTRGGHGGRFPAVEPEEYLEWLHDYAASLEWDETTGKKKKLLTKEILQQSLELGCRNLVSNQKEAGNFNYQYDFVAKEMDEEDSQVRQAGALWGVTLCFQHFPHNAALGAAALKGIDFFVQHSVAGPGTGTSVIKYPGDDDVSDTGTNALFGLSLVDYLRTLKQHRIDTLAPYHLNQLHQKLRSVIQFLLQLQQDSQHFASEYNLQTGKASRHSNPYYDGETLLCLIKAAQYMGDGDYKAKLVPVIEAAAPVLAKAYTVDAWHAEQEHDSDTTKGFSQWSSMALAAYYDAGWKDGDALAANFCMSMAHWIVHTHKILHRTRNTGYAYEGLASAYQVAKRTGNSKAAAALAEVMDQGLYALTTWQVGGPLAARNPFLAQHHATDEAIAVGGVMNAKDKAPLRIDTTQHQMHAVMLALEAGLYDGDDENHSPKR